MTDYVSLMPFAASVGIVITVATPTEVIGRLDWHEARTTTGGTLHGGALITLADSTSAVCAFLNLPKDASTSTTSLSSVFTRGIRSGTAIATSRPLHVGRSTIAIATEIRDDDERLLVQVIQSQAILSAV
jgi:1,4-dihydroxy-2-naphthoyl-CoA hydrolase